VREVLAVIYLLLNEGYLSTAERGQSRDLVDDAERLAAQLYDLMPTEPAACALAGHPLAPLDRAALHAGPQAALGEVDALAATLERHHLYHPTRADLLRALGRADESRAADRRALELTANPAEQALLRRTIDWTDDAR